ncbi:MAG: hypothetical protein JXO51_09930, partial [Candidatus Aminicenantes bacterium]|nr:hypothetical protein [Candidatus Aminicenantes bacterium]
MKRFIPIFWLLALALPLRSVRFPFINYRSSEGLPQSNVTALLQDRDGIIWVGTQSGIGRFDGARFETLTTLDGLAGNYITDLELDREGGVWAASQQGLSRIRHAQVVSVLLPESFVRDIAYSPIDRVLWALTSNGLFTVRDGVAERFERILDPALLRGLAAGRSGMVFYGRDAVMLLKNGRLQSFPAPGEVVFAKEAEGHLFVGCRDGLYVLNPFGEFKKYSGLPEGMDPVRDILFDVQKNLWIAGRGGVFYKDLQTGAGTVFTMDSGLVYDRASHLLLDRENNIFIGTEFGLSQLSRHIFRMYGPEDGLPSTQVWDILEDGDGLLLACDDGVAELRGGRIRAFAVNRLLANRSVRAIIKMGPHRYFLGCREGDIFEWDGAGRLAVLTSGVNVLYALRDSRDRAWFATDRGLLRYDGGEFTWLRQGLNDPIVWDIAELEPGTLLVGTRRGVQVLRDGTFVHSPWEEQVGPITVNDIFVVSPREVLLAMERNGLIWLRGDGVKRLGPEQGMLHNDVWSVLRDDNGHIWMNTTAGMERYDRDGTFAHFNKRTGLFGDEGCIHAALKSRSGNLYFGVVPGLVEYSFFADETPPRRPVLMLRDPLVKGTPRRLGPATPLPHDQNTVEFRFICPTTSRETSPLYKTRLFPFDNDWSLPGRGTTVRYTNLPPGTYTFQALANNGGDEWFGLDRRIVFTIRRPFWKQWWFVTLEALLALAALAAVVQLRVRALQRQKRRLEEVVQARTAEIAEKNLELARLSITDPLTGL